MKTNFINFKSDLLDDFVSGETFKSICDYYYKPTAYDQGVHLDLKSNITIFSKTEYALNELFFILNNNKQYKNINVITHNSDILIDANIAAHKPSNVLNWYAINSTFEHPSITPIPLGIANSYCHITTKINDIKQVNTNNKRNGLLYVNFRPETYPPERQPLFDLFLNKNKKGETWFNICADNKNNTTSSFLKDMIEHKFILCPRGNGVDTHRLWEALYSKTIPIIKYEPAYRFFIDLPIVFIKDWSEITEDFLHKKYEQMQSMEFNFNKLKTSWWKTKIKNDT